MDSESKKPALNDLFVDARPCAEYLIDLAPGERQGLRVALDGFLEAAAEVVDNQSHYGDRAGISEKDFETFSIAVERKDQIQARLRVARKLVEVLEESEAVHDDSAQRQIFGFAQVIEARAKAYGDPELLARYEKTRAYRSAVGIKAAKTRRRNEAELESPQNEELPQELPIELPIELPAVEESR
jgi:hypothetical protein